MPQTSLRSYFKASDVVPNSLTDVPPVARPLDLPQITNVLNLTASSAVTHDSGGDFSEPQSDHLASLYEDKDHADDSGGSGIVPSFSEIAIIPVQRSHLPGIQRLTSTLLQVRYPSKFFSGSVEEIIPAIFSRVALSMSKPIGWIRCRLEPFPERVFPPSNAKPIYNRIYVQALCLLAPYRGQGVATALLESILKPQLLLEHDIEAIYAHVWECNEEALEWYAKRGFHQEMLIEDYYHNLRPPGAWIVRRDLR